MIRAEMLVLLKNLFPVCNSVNKVVVKASLVLF